jgi:cytochrome c-type biogenesis protein
MLPILVGYVGGMADTRNPTKIATSIALFVVGVSLTLALFGTVAALLGLTFGAWVGEWSQWLVAVVSLGIGGQLLNWWHIPVPQWMSQLPDVDDTKPRHPLVKALLSVGLGMLYGAASSPCGTPFLAGILTLISQTGAVALGAVSLFAYGLGQGTLLLVAGLFTGFIKRLAVIRQVGSALTLMSGLVFILLGVFFALEAVGVVAMIEPAINAWLLGESV